MTTGASIEAGADRSESATLLIASLAAVTFGLARHESAVSLLPLTVEMLVSLGAAWSIWCGLRWKARRRLEAALPAVVLGAVLWPLSADQMARQWGLGDPLETLLLACLQGAALVTAAYSHRRRCQQVACLLSGFLVLFAIVIGTRWGVFVVAGIFGVMMLWWLMARYWERVCETLAACQTERCLPLRGSVVAGVAGILLVLSALLGTTAGSTYVLGGFMPTSGGDRWSDERARAGVGDGDAMVAAKEDAQSFGPVESELFLDSQMPTLYDMFNDMYGEPPDRVKKRQERSISLAPGSVRESEQRVAQTQRSGREFSAVRRKVPDRRKTLEDRAAPAMLYVVGQVRLHLALARYDTFDGREWTHISRYPASSLRVEIEGGRPWIGEQLGLATAVFRGSHSHALKIVNLKTGRVPSPPQLSAVHVDKVDQAGFFGWTDDGVLEMAGRDHIPQLTVLRVRSHGIDLSSLRQRDFTAQSGVIAERAELLRRHLRLPESGGSAERIGERVAEWTRGVPRGWRQVEAIVTGVRSSFQLDPRATLPEACDDAVEHFLHAGRGPDYLFATTAAVMLRTAGYPARLVTGFYARSDRFERRAGQTAVLAEDVHAWVEVCIDGWTWIPVEPTPGYEAPREQLDWHQRLARMGWNLLARSRRHAPLLTFLGAGFVVVGLTRLVWCDWLLVAYFTVTGWGGSAQRVRATLRLLECRAWLAGAPRPPAATVSRWYSARAVGLTSDAAHELAVFLGGVEQLLYGPQEDLGLHDRKDRFDAADRVKASCRVVVRELGVSRLRSAAAERSVSKRAWPSGPTNTSIGIFSGESV